MSEHIFKSHNKTLLLYHLVFPAKYRRKVFTTSIEDSLVNICIEISQRYEICFLEIGNDEDHVHFLVQGIPKMPVSRIVQIIKSITAREVFAKHPEVKKQLWGGNLWTSEFYANTVGQFANEEIIRNYVKDQGKKYTKIHTGQLMLDL
ncbi:IS200/IS605 family transposase [Sulfurimonas sp. SAG-AH-194-C21]|nr:IS200/IS605 family transposase [Sulfurimonas sp. SAG-AH-194-C21]MDF1883365.1 IS200/IS605 family transposase [Sulfurimonas sp. SAG-AH-194-C21]